MKKEKLFYYNTLMLYILQFSNYFFNFIVVPYQTRVLGPAFFGKLGLATALTTYFQLVLDYGFILSATEDVALHQKNTGYLCRLFSSVVLIKTILIVGSFLALGALCQIPRFSADSMLYFAYLINACIYALLPDYLYRGMEKMTLITFRTVGIKFIFTLLVFILLKKPEDYLIVPISLAIGNLLAVIWSWLDIYKRFKIRLVKVDLTTTITIFKKATNFFGSRIISTVYTTMNTLIIGFWDPTGVVVGHYSAADKLITTGKSALSPISDSLYPYIVKNKDFKVVKKILCLFMPIIITGSVLIFIFAPQLCVILFGENFRASGTILRLMMPIAVITLPNYIFGFPVLGAMGLSQQANNSIWFGTIIHIICLVVLFALRKINIYSITILMSITEFNILMYRLFVFFKNRRLVVFED